MRAIPVILALLWTAFFTWSFHDINCNSECCQKDVSKIGATNKQDDNAAKNEVSKGVTNTVVASSPLWFRWNKDEVETTDAFAAYRDSILRTLDKDDLLKIIGQYYGDEKNPNTNFENLGMARADAVMGLFSKHITDDRILLASNLLEGKSGLGDSFFESVTFEKEKRDKTVAKSKVRNSMEIRFPYGSDQKLNDPSIDTYLTKVAKQVSASGERIKLTGHTDTDSSSEFNQRLGLKRAKAIKAILIRKGVNANKISTSSMGETDPIASNSTEAGKQKNRRTELEIIK